MTSTLRLLALVLFAALLPALALADEADQEIYRLGAGDILLVIIHPGGESNAIETEITVAGDGTIDVVHAGRIKVGGLGTSEAREMIRKKLIGSGVYLQPQVSVNVKEYKSQGVNVAGAVHKQGRYYLQGPTRLLDVLSQAEGIDDEKAGSAIVITREGAEVPIKINRRDLFAADVEKVRNANIRVISGDNVNVPLKSRFCISGAVKDPGCYDLDDATTLYQAISMGGGLVPDTADRKNVVIRRASGAGELKVDLDVLEAGKLPAPFIEADDVVVVGTREKTQFCVEGQVEKPDCYEYEKGLTLDGAISKAGGFKIDLANKQEIKITRKVDGADRVYMASMDDPSERGARFPILNQDQIVVAKADCLVTVNGAAATPGTYPLTTGMTIVDAIAVAGGTHGQSQWGKLGNVNLTRAGGKVEVVNVKAIQEGKTPDIPLHCGDKIYIKAKAF